MGGGLREKEGIAMEEEMERRGSGWEAGAREGGGVRREQGAGASGGACERGHGAQRG